MHRVCILYNYNLYNFYLQVVGFSSDKLQRWYLENRPMCTANWNTEKSAFGNRLRYTHTYFDSHCMGSSCVWTAQQSNPASHSAVTWFSEFGASEVYLLNTWQTTQGQYKFN